MMVVRFQYVILEPNNYFVWNITSFVLKLRDCPKFRSKCVFPPKVLNDPRQLNSDNKAFPSIVHSWMGNNQKWHTIRGIVDFSLIFGTLLQFLSIKITWNLNSECKKVKQYYTSAWIEIPIFWGLNYVILCMFCHFSPKMHIIFSSTVVNSVTFSSRTKVLVTYH